MHIKEIYRALYRRFDTLTPLPFDCGQLCGKLCCQPAETDEDCGMYLFPGEDALFFGVDGFRILDSELLYGDGRRAKLLCCTRPCARKTRPLSCRIFPLVPYFRPGSAVRVIPDPRASACPLTRPEALPLLQRRFRAEVLHAFRLLARFSEVAAFLDALSDVLDEINDWRGLFL